MMYIEHTPLEADPKFTNRSRIAPTNPVSAATPQFANSHEAAEATFEFATNGDLNNCPIEIENGFDNQQYKFQISFEPAKFQDEKIDNQNEFEVFGIKINPHRQSKNNQKQNLSIPTNQQEKDVEVEDEIFELIDVFDEDADDLKQKNDLKSTLNQSNQIYINNSHEKANKTDHLKVNGFPNKNTIEKNKRGINNFLQRSSSTIQEAQITDTIIESDVDEEELLKPWKRPVDPILENSDLIETDEDSRESTLSSLCSPPQQVEEHSAVPECHTDYILPPLPQAIPIPELFDRDPNHPLVRELIKCTQKIFESNQRDSTHDYYIPNNNQSFKNHYQESEPESDAQPEVIVLNGNYFNLYSVGSYSDTDRYLIDDKGKFYKESSLEDEFAKLGPARQMGLDIFTKLKRLFQFSSRPEPERVEQKRKRRASDDWVGENYHPLNKYRKTEKRSANFPPTVFGYNRAMAQSKSSYMNSGKSQSRKSWFMSPKHKYVKNTAYADLEFSDDECDATKISVRRPTAGNHFNNIPLNPLRDNPAHSTLKSYSSLYDKLPRDVLREQPQRPSINDYMRGGLASSTSSSAVSTVADAANSIKFFNNNRENQLGGFNRSVLLQEQESNDREKYQRFLQSIKPTLYGRKPYFDAAAKLNLNSTGSNTSLDDNKFLKYITDRQTAGHHTSKAPRAMSTIDLDDNNAEIFNVDDDDDDNSIFNDLQAIGQNRKPKSFKSTRMSETVKVNDDSDDDEENIGIKIPECVVKITNFNAKMREDLQRVREKKKKPVEVVEIPKVEPVNSLKELLQTCEHFGERWLTDFQSKWSQRRAKTQENIKETEKEVLEMEKNRRILEAKLNENMRSMTIIDSRLFRFESPYDQTHEEDEEPELVPLTNEHYKRIQFIISGPEQQVIVSKFNLNITRGDLRTLCDSTWLNDEVINFYMNLLTDRSEKRTDLPRCYAMNTFFLPRLLQSGYTGVKRWTRKVDLFSKDIIPMPVHVGSVHWCMAVIHLKQKYIRYYDSMGTPNPRVLDALENYLKSESEDKRKQSFDTSGFKIESVDDVPRQMNGSDCGVFSCMFAEYLTRNRPITFSQENMEYFRKKMMVEISNGELLQ